MRCRGGIMINHVIHMYIWFEPHIVTLKHVFIQIINYRFVNMKFEFNVSSIAFYSENSKLKFNLIIPIRT